MKIIVPNLQIPILHDVAQCLESIKEVASLSPLLWNVQNKPLLDLCDETHPDIIFLHVSQLDIAFAMACHEFNFQYILIGEGVPNNLPRPPVAILSTQEFLHHFPKEYNVIQIKNGARVTQIHNAQYDQDIECDVLVHTTDVNLTSQIFDILYFLVSRYSTKIIGESPVSLHHYLGEVTMFERANFIKSSKVIIDLNGQDMWDASYLKVPALCAQASTAPFLHFNDVTTLKSQIDMMLENNNSRDSYVDTCYTNVCNGNTYYHLTAKVFNSINNNIAEHLNNYIEGLIG